MILPGVQKSRLLKARLRNEACPYCGSVGTLRAKVFGRYVHLVAVPLFPIGKYVTMRCAHCLKAWNEATLPDALLPAAQTLKQRARIPWQHWLGPLLLVVLVGWGIVAGRQDDRTDRTYLAAPKAGDIYTVRLKTSDSLHYSLLKVRQVYGNRLELLANRSESTKAAPLHDLNQPERYDTTSFIVTQFDVQIMYNKGEITEIDRPE